MARGPKKHLKRLNAPKHWMLNKMGGIYAPRPSQGPHKLRECLPLLLVLRNRLKYALTRREVMMICMRRLIQVDHKVRTDVSFPTGLMDVVSIDKTNEHYRILFDHKGRFQTVAISEKEAQYKLLRVIRVSKAKKATIGRNPYHNGQAGTIPYIVTHDGRTIRYPDPLIDVNDTIKFNLKSGKVEGILKFDTGSLVMVTKGGNVGRVGVVSQIERHSGSFHIVHVKDRRGHSFTTRLENVFVIGDDKPWITLPKNKGIKLSVIETMEKRQRGEK